MANQRSTTMRQWESYEDTGKDASIEITLDATPGDVTTVTVANNVKGFRLFPRANHIRFAVNATVAAVATSSSNTIAVGDFAVGGIAKNDQWETRLLPSGASRTITLRSTTASVVVDFVVF